jgi:uncharacterized membrane protein YgdD (TMEM256/DUF423 family)
MEPARLLLTVGAVSAATALALFAAHGLKARLTAEALSTFQTGVTYHFFHSIALVLVALAIRSVARPVAWSQPFALAGLAFAIGILLFSGSLYALATGGPRWLGPVTPLGGLAFLSGWALFAFAAWRA